MTLWYKFLRGILIAGVLLVTGPGVCLANHAVRVSDLDAAGFVRRYNELAEQAAAPVRLSSPLASGHRQLQNYLVYETKLIGMDEKERIFLHVNRSGALSSIVIKNEGDLGKKSLEMRRVFVLFLESLGLTAEECGHFFSTEEREKGRGGVLHQAWCSAAGRKIVSFHDPVHAPDVLVLYAWDE